MKNIDLTPIKQLVKEMLGYRKEAQHAFRQSIVNDLQTLGYTAEGAEQKVDEFELEVRQART